MSEVKKCPKCSGDMEKGYLLFASWAQEEPSLWVFPKGKGIIAYRCKSCAYLEFYTREKKKE
jgi:predicted nucleic-acid-binding Zn-ribbon protein